MPELYGRHIWLFFGAMVNYLKLDMLEENSRMYRERGVIKSHLSWGLRINSKRLNVNEGRI